MSHSATLTINRKALVANYRHSATLSGGATCGVAVKANCYGLGMEVVLPILWHEDCHEYFVAHVSEGVKARTILPQAIIYVLNGYAPIDLPLYIAHNLIPVVNDAAKIPPIAYALMVETGMNRLGVSMSEAHVICTTQPPALIMSHFACADDKNHPQNALQISRFNALTKAFPHIRASLANSDGLHFEAAHHQLTRVGIGIYDGVNNVVTLTAPILQIKPLKAGEFVGYGATYKAVKDTHIAIVSLGYADGFLRAGQGGYALVDGQKCEIIGRVSMDLIALDVGNARGTDATFIGDDVRLSVVAGNSKTISYEILTRLGSRLTRKVI